MRTLTRRLVLLTVAVACASTLVTTGLLLTLARGASVEAARQVLGRDAQLLAGVQRRSGPGRLGVAAVTEAYQRRGIVVATTTATAGGSGGAAGPGGEVLPEPFEAADLAAAAAGGVSRTATWDGRRWIVEGRASGSAVALLAQPQGEAAGLVPASRRRIALAVLIAALGGAAGGALVARALTRPLVRLDAAARRLAAGERAVSVPEDGPAEISDLAAALNALSRALADSEDRQRRFLLTVSHELRTPLTAVMGYGEALADGVVTGDGVRDAGRVVVEESARLGRRVEELLALARLEADDVTADLTDIDAAAVVVAAHIAWVQRARLAGVQLRVDLPGRPVLVRADPERLRQAVDALVDNALRVLAGVGPGAGSAPVVVLAAAPAAGAGTVEVRDNGPGLAAEDLADAFTPGVLRDRYRGRRPVGSGVGLALVGRLAALMAGHAVAFRAPEGGLGVRLVLPPAQVRSSASSDSIWS